MDRLVGVDPNPTATRSNTGFQDHPTGPGTTLAWTSEITNPHSRIISAHLREGRSFIEVGKITAAAPDSRFSGQADSRSWRCASAASTTRFTAE